MFFHLAWRSLLSRKSSIFLSLLSISVSVFVLLGIEHIRLQAKSSFSSTVSGVDLIVGARTGDINLLLYSVFRLGSATNNIRWSSYQAIKNRPEIAWSIPIALGDSHKGFAVMGTSTDYFAHFKYGKKRPLSFTQGRAFSQVFDVVLGAAVAQQLNYQLGDKITLAHGMVSTHFSEHKDKPFKVVGILQRTGTPVDQTVHVSLQGLEAVHIKGKIETQQYQKLQHIKPQSLTAFMLGLKSKATVFYLQRQINNSPKEPLLAILPGVSLSQLWQIMASVEYSLQIISALVLLTSLLGLSAMLLASIRERQQEINILRMLGASPRFVFMLIQLEALLTSLLAIALALSLMPISLMLASDWLSSEYGLNISHWPLNQNTSHILAAILISTCLVSLAPAFFAYRRAK